MDQEKYNSIKEIPVEGGWFMNFPGVYCKNCGEIFALYSFSGNQPHGIDENKKPYYNSCPMCSKVKSIKLD